MEIAISSFGIGVTRQKLKIKQDLLIKQALGTKILPILLSIGPRILGVFKHMLQCHCTT